MGYHPAATRLFAEWSNRRMTKAGVKFDSTGGTMQCRSDDGVSLSAAENLVQDWRTFGASVVMRNPRDSICPTYDGHQAAARVNLRDLEQDEHPELVVVAKKLIAMMTMCPPTNTPVDFFLDGQWAERVVLFSCQHYWERSSDGAVKISNSEDMTKEAIEALQRHALIDKDGNQLAMHQLMAKAVKKELKAEASGSHPGVFELHALLTARFCTDDEEVHVYAEEYAVMGHVAEYALKKLVKRTDNAALKLQARVLEASICGYIGRASQYYHELDQALEYHARALGIWMERLGPRHSCVAKALRAIGRALYYECDRAMDFYTCALGIQMDILGPRHPDTAMTLYLLGCAFGSKNEPEPDRALDYVSRALHVQVETLGPIHPKVAITLHDIGCMMCSKGHFDEALGYFTRSLSIKMEKLGRRHTSVAVTLNMIGNAFCSKKDYKQALKYYTRALDIFFETFGAHPRTARVLSNLSYCLKRENQHTAAADCIVCCLHMLVSNPAFEQSLVLAVKDGRYGCRVDVLVQQQRWKDALPLLPSLDRVADLAAGDSHVCLYLTAAAEVYRQCGMPSRAVAALRRAAAALRQLGASLPTDVKQHFQDSGLEMDLDKLELSALQLLENMSSFGGDSEANIPPLPVRVPTLLRLPLPVRVLKWSRQCHENHAHTLINADCGRRPALHPHGQAASRSPVSVAAHTRIHAHAAPRQASRCRFAA
jgi:tetratricopeptide (TPR) repeat protein